jgi:DNA-binding HxlR family transcriptional regulator
MAIEAPWAAAGHPCPIEVTLGVIGGKWKVIILYWLKTGTLRFGELKRRITGVSERVLAEQLRELERDGVVRREVFPEVPPRVEYSLTDYGQTLRPIAELMAAWGLNHLERIKAKKGSGTFEFKGS